MIAGIRPLPDRTEVLFMPQGSKRRPQTWYECDADTFENYWLRKMDNGEIPRPTPAELSALDNDRDEWKLNGESSKLTHSHFVAL